MLRGYIIMQIIDSFRAIEEVGVYGINPPDVGRMLRIIGMIIDWVVSPGSKC
jgi:hypothetical protein